MRIGLVIERMETWRGGAETSTAQFASELIGRGHAIRLFTASRGVSEPGVEVHTLALPRGRSRRGAGFRLAVEAALKEFPCDVTHSMTPLYGGDVFMPRGGTVAETIEGNLRVRRSALGRDLKRVLNVFNRRQQMMLRLERDLLLRNPPGRIVALSRYVAEQLKTHYRLGPDRVVEVFNGVTVPDPGEAERSAAREQVRAEWGLGRDGYVLLFVGHNFKLKGLPQLVDAAGVLSQRRPDVDWRLLIVGRDRPGPSVARADRWGISKRVVFAGSSERVWRFYLSADLLVLPTFYDPCSRVVLEAVCLGTPAVTTRYNGAAEILAGQDGRASAGAVIADPHDTNELVRAIESFADPARRRESSLAGLALRESLSMRRHTDEMLAVYEQAMGR